MREDGAVAADDPLHTSADGGDPFRSRLLDGLAASIEEKGYRETTVADIVRHARTSKRTFYDQFGNKDDCLLELLEIENARMISDILSTVDPEGHWHAQVEQAVGSYVATIESRPAIWLAWIREFPALGDRARPVQRRTMERLTGMLMDLTTTPGFVRADFEPVTRRLALVLFGGLRELTADTMERGEEIRSITETAVTAAAALVSRAHAR
ncbi:TetR family transcriptional regulator [Mycobacterium sp. djl-10]|nr:TetR family transcriptional regulator [Mycobacterium sp. djl-10]